MLPMSNRWVVVAALLVSGALWLAISSSAANAVHVLAKGNFTWNGFGSVSVWLLFACLLWAGIVGNVVSINGTLSARAFGICACIVVIWVLLLSVVTALGDEWFASLKAASLLVWVVEVMVAVLLVMYLDRQWPALPSIQWPWLCVVSLSLLVGAKALLLSVLPGMAVQF